MIASLLIPLIKMDINLYTNDNYREIKFKIQNKYNFGIDNSNFAEDLINNLKGGQYE